MIYSKFLTYSRRMLGILFLLPTVLWAQKPANYVFTSSSGTFSSIVQGTNAVLVAKASGTSGAASIDDVIYNLTASTIPFTFTYDSVGYTGLNISTNGFITFGSTAPSSTSGTPLSATTTYAGAISAFGRDLNGLYTSSDTGQIWYSVEGTSPNREFVIEWANFKNYTTTTTDFHKMSIQIRLHENNSIRFVYSYAAVGSPTTTALTPQVGLRGANNTFASNVNNRLMVAGQNSWVQSYPGTANSSTMRMDPNYYMANGQTYTFTPPVACNGTPSVSNIMGVAYSCGVTLNLYNNSASYFDHYGYAYSWQESTDGTNYSAVSSGTVGKGTYSRTSVSLPLYFRVRAICSTTNDTGYSTAVQVQSPDTLVKKWAGLPYTTSYQSDWLNGACFNGEMPDSAWIIYPRTGNNSWRRNDYGTQASWSSISGAYTPTGANSTTRSARFHSFNATSGTRGAMYFHFDASTLSGTKEISFSYINTSGSDSFFVYLSTDTGKTYSQIGAYGVSSAWTKNIITLGSLTQSRCVLKFEGKSDAGSTDIGLDEIEVYKLPDLDMAMTAILSPNSSSCSSSGVSATVRVKNNGAATIDFTTNPVYLTMAISGVQTLNILDTLNTGTLASGATLDVTMATNLSFTQTGVSTVRAWLNTATDPNATNDTAANVTIERITSASLPYSQGFENLATLSNWLVQQVSGTGNWSVRTTAMTNPTLSAATGSNFLYFNSYSFGQGTTSRAMSPCLNLIGADNPYLSFKLSKSSAYVNDPDSLYIQYSLDGGSSWTNAAGYTRLDTGASSAYWQEYSVCLPMLANTDNVRIALLGISSYGDNFGVDDLSLKDVDLSSDLQLTTDTMCLGDSNYAVISGTHSNLLYLVYTDNTFSGSVLGNNSGNVSVALTALGGGTHTIKVFAQDTMANCGAYLYDSATVKVNTPYYISVGPDTSFCAGDSVLLQSTAGHLNYRWNTNDLGQDLWISTAGTYIIYAQDSNTCALSDTLVATIDALPTPNLGNDTSFCENVGFTLDAGSYSAYVWNDNSNGQTLVATTGGDYAVTVTNAAGCSATDSIFLVMNPAPTTTLTDATICADSFAIFDGGAGYASYFWTRTNDSGQYTVGQPGMNILIVTTALGCSKTDTAFVNVNALPAVNLGANIAVCVGTSVNLSSTGSFQTYLWSDNSSATTLGISAGGTYWLLVSDGNGCRNTDSVEVVFSKPPVDLGPDTGFCTGGSFALDAGNSSFSYVWSTSPNDVNPTLIVTAAGTYSVVVTDSINCTNMDTVEVIEYSLPNVNIGADQAICFGDSALFAEADRPVLYNWNNGETDSLAYYDQAGTVILRITDLNGCINRDTAELTINSLPSPNIGPDTAICAGHNLVLSPGTIFAGYLWSTGSGASAITVSTAATYSLTVTDANGCKGSDQMILSVNALPDASFTFIDNGQNQIDFNANDTLKGFFWRFGDGDTSTMDDPQHQYPGQGNYTVTLLVIDSNYCVDSTTQSLSLTSLRNTFSRLDVQVYPNPTSNQLQVSMDLANSADLFIELYDIQGKLLQTRTTPAVQGEHSETFDLSALAPGNYTLRIQHGSDVATFKVVKVGN